MVFRIFWRLYRLFRKHIMLGIGIIALMILLFGYLFFFFAFPMMILGSPLSLYTIDNFNTENHTINVKIFDENNVSVLNKTYNLSPGEQVRYERRIGWEPKISWYPFTWADGKYNFHITVDNIYSEWQTEGVSFSCTLHIWIFYKDRRTNETNPIMIKVSCV